MSGEYLRQKTVLITGASSGFGRRLALDLAPHGTDLLLVARNGPAIEELARQACALGARAAEALALDVRDRAAVDRVVSSLLDRHQVDVLVNNAGLALGLEPLEEGDPDDWDTMIDTNLKGLLYVSRLVLAQMRRRDTGHVVLVGSMAGRMPYPGGNVYCATKAAVHALGQALNADLLGTGIKVSVVAPGAARTNFSTVRFHGDQDRADEVYEGFEPLTAADVSRVICWILDTPPHVNIQHVDVMATAQRNPYLLARSERQES